MCFFHLFSSFPSSLDHYLFWNVVNKQVANIIYCSICEFGIRPSISPLGQTVLLSQQSILPIYTEPHHPLSTISRLSKVRSRSLILPQFLSGLREKRALNKFGS